VLQKILSIILQILLPISMDIWLNANRNVDATLEKREHAGPIHRSLSAPPTCLAAVCAIPNQLNKTQNKPVK
jgi:hypothetical protein